MIEHTCDPSFPNVEAEGSLRFGASGRSLSKKLKWSNVVAKTCHLSIEEVEAED